MANRQDHVDLRNGNVIRSRESARRVGAKRCRFVSYTLLQPPKAAKAAKPARRRRGRAG